MLNNKRFSDNSEDRKLTKVLDFSKKKIMIKDVCIIGGGIAGNFLASQLSKKNIGCIVIEEHKELGKPFQCAGIIAQKIMKIPDFPEDVILNRIHRAQIYSPTLEKLTMQGKERPVVIDRIKFDRYYGELAQQRGAVYLLGEKYLDHWKRKNPKSLNSIRRIFLDENLILVNKISIKHRKAIDTEHYPIFVETNKHYILTKIVVGADGPFSRVGKKFGVFIKNIPATQARVKFKFPIHDTAMFFNPEWKELFGYIVPEGKNGVCRIGLATKKHPNLAFKKFLNILKIKNEDIISRQGGIIPFGFPKMIAFDNTVLLGDSAGMVKASTGGGIVMLTAAASILVETIEKALKKKNFSRNFFVRYYQHPVKIILGTQLKIHYFLRILLMNFDKSDYSHFFKLYRTTNLKAIVDNYADMDYPLVLIKELAKNRNFISFLIRMAIKNIKLIPILLKDLLK